MISFGSLKSNEYTPVHEVRGKSQIFRALWNIFKFGPDRKSDRLSTTQIKYKVKNARVSPAAKAAKAPEVQKFPEMIKAKQPIRPEIPYSRRRAKLPEVFVSSPDRKKGKG